MKKIMKVIKKIKRRKNHLKMPLQVVSLAALNLKKVMNLATMSSLHSTSLGMLMEKQNRIEEETWTVFVEMPDYLFLIQSKFFFHLFLSNFIILTPIPSFLSSTESIFSI